MEKTRFLLLFVDDEPDMLDTLTRSFRKEYDIVTANSGQAGIDAIKQHDVDLIICDQRMPDLTGDKVLKFAREHRPEAIRVLLTGYSDMESLVNCVNEAGIYKYITKPWEPENLRLTVLRALEALSLERKLNAVSEQLKESYQNAVTMLSFACEGKDEDTGQHVRRIQHFTEKLALAMGQNAIDAEYLGVMSILHDIGKLSIPDAILKKPAKLDDAEWVEMKRHPEYGVKILGEAPYYAKAREIAGGHHENYDGSGYPCGKQGEDIPLSARLVKVADVFDALTSRRPYKEPWTVERAMAEITSQSGRQFDPAVVDALGRIVADGTVAEIMARFQAPPG